MPTTTTTTTVDNATYPEWVDTLDRLLERRWNASVLDFDYPYERRYASGYSTRSTFLDLVAP